MAREEHHPPATAASGVAGVELVADGVDGRRAQAPTREGEDDLLFQREMPVEVAEQVFEVGPHQDGVDGHAGGHVPQVGDEHRQTLVDDVLGHIDEDWRALATEVRVKKFGRSRPAEFKDKARQMRFLQYRGFEQDQVRAAVSALDE